MHCRIETGPHVPSRQEVLTKAEAIRRTPEKLSARSRKSNASTNKYFGVNTEINKNENENKTKVSNDKMGGETNEDENNKNIEKLNTKQTELKEINQNLNKNIVQTHDIGLNRDRNGKQYKKKPSQTNHMPYLSQKNLETHNRLIRDGWEHLIDDEDNENKPGKGHKKSKITKRQEERGHLDKDKLIKKAQEFLNERKLEKAEKARKNKHRIIQRSSDFVFQRSKADSYKALFEKKQKYAEQTQREEQLKLRKTQSSDDIWKKQIADKVFETFKEERKKLSRQKRLALKDHVDLGENERGEKDKYLNQTQKYFTRDTKNRYKQTSQGNDEEIYDEFERKNRIQINDVNMDNDIKHSEKQSKTERSDRKSTYPVSKKTRSERHLIDTDREDQYMMDMDFLAKEREERERQKKERSEATDTDAEEFGDRDKSEKSRTMRRDRLIALTSSENKNKEMDQHIESTEVNRLKGQGIQYDNHEHREQNTPNLQNDQAIISGTDAVFEKELSAYSLKETEIQQPTSIHGNLNKKDSLMFEESIDTGNEEIQALTSGKTCKSYSVYSLTGKKAINDSFTSRNGQYGRQGTGRVQFVQAYTDRLKETRENPKLTKTVNWKLGKKMTKENLYLFNEERRKATRVPRVDEVTIRDKLRLQINVVDQKIDDSDKIETEKKKIRRFWEAVGGKEMKGEKEMFGEIDNKEKMLVAKVTKERIMSAKTKASRQSKGSVVTHNVGDFNVTLEVGN